MLGNMSIIQLSISKQMMLLLRLTLKFPVELLSVY